MLGWRRRNQGFEWRQYVRTTILLRRERRKERLEEVRHAAVEGLQNAGRRGVEAGSAGIVSAGGWLRRGLRQGGNGLKVGLAAAGRGIRGGVVRAGAGVKGGLGVVGPRLAPAGRAIAGVAQPGLKALGQPGIALSLALVAAVCAAAGGFRIASQGFDTEGAIPLAVAGVCALLLLGGRLADAGHWPGRFHMAGSLLTGRGGLVLGAGALLAAATAGGWWLLRAPQEPAAIAARQASRIAANSPNASAAGTLSGRAIVRSGDLLRLAGTSVRLEGIEAPMAGQVCSRGTSGRTWKCGQAAKDALTRLVRGKKVSCEVGRQDESGKATGSCHVDGTDLAMELVKHGHVFAEQGMFARYGSHEGEARAAGAGLWAGEAERPADYRAKRWETAKKAAPDACPIKAVVTSEGRVYLLPWSATYERAKVRSGRGERWFCSEDEAKAAGWKPNDKL